MNFSDTNYVIVGGTTGLGLAASLALQQAGARVLAIGIDMESSENAQQQFSEGSFVLTGDATLEKTVPEAIQFAEEKFGALNGLYHVAGGSGRKWGDGPLHKMSLEGWNKTLELNLTSMMLSNQAIINYFLRENKAGSILNMGSVLGYSPSPKYFVTHAYAAAKSAVIGYSKSIAAYYASYNIRVNVVAPALFSTPMAQRAITDHTIQSFIKTKQPLDGGRHGWPEDINHAVLMFLSPNSRFITGQVLAVDGGWTISEGQY